MLCCVMLCCVVLAFLGVSRALSSCPTAIMYTFDCTYVCLAADLGRWAGYDRSASR